MDFFYEYGLLVAVASPVTILLCMNICLALGGESGTLLWPTL